MSIDRSIGLAGLIVGLLAIAAFYLAPNRKWIGVLCLSIAVALLALWGWQEIKVPLLDVAAKHRLLSALIAALCGGLLTGLFWWVFIVGEPKQPSPLPQAEPLPSLLFVVGAPLGDNNSPIWIMVLKHFGPDAAYNCQVTFSDDDRKNIEHEWLVKHPEHSFLPAGVFDPSQANAYAQEANPEGITAGSFNWRPLDPDRQHYTVSINCRDGVFVEKWEVVRVSGVLRTRISIEHGPEWIRKNPKSDPLVFQCQDPAFIAAPLLTVAPPQRPTRVNPGWKPNHLFQFPVAIIDPNGNIQMMSGVKLPNGETRTDFGCWNVLTKHFGDAPR